MQSAMRAQTQNPAGWWAFYKKMILKYESKYDEGHLSRCVYFNIILVWCACVFEPCQKIYFCTETGSVLVLLQRAAAPKQQIERRTRMAL